jgi:hypothetical protein
MSVLASLAVQGQNRCPSQQLKPVIISADKYDKGASSNNHGKPSIGNATSDESPSRALPIGRKGFGEVQFHRHVQDLRIFGFRLVEWAHGSGDLAVPSQKVTSVQPEISPF